MVAVTGTNWGGSFKMASLGLMEVSSIQYMGKTKHMVMAVMDAYFKMDRHVFFFIRAPP
jgi:hypothetical protein